MTKTRKSWRPSSHTGKAAIATALCFESNAGQCLAVYNLYYVPMCSAYAAFVLLGSYSVKAWWSNSKTTFTMTTFERISNQKVTVSLTSFMTSRSGTCKR